MPVEKVHQLHGMNIFPDDLGAALLLGITQQTIFTNTNIIKDASSANIYPEVVYVNAQNPGATFSTNHVQAAMNSISLSGLCIRALSNPGVEMFARRLDCIGPDNGMVHRKFTFREGVIVPRTLQCDHQGNVTINYELIASNDGTNAALVIEDNQNTVAIPRRDYRWTLGPMTIAGVAINSRRSLEIDFGNQVTVEGADSDIEPTLVAVIGTQPRITLRGVEAVDWYSGAIVEATHGDSILYLRNRAEADGTPQHISTTFAGRVFQQQVFDATGVDTGTVDLIIETHHDGTNVPLLINTAAVIP